MSLLPNYYVILGVAASATPEEVRQAYRLRAREAHPDARPDDAGAAARFKLIAEAYRVLANAEERLAYDAQLRMLAATDEAEQRPHTPTPRRPQPELAMRTLPGADAIGPLTQPTRFYLLAELAPASESVAPWTQPLNLAILLDRSSSMHGPKIFEAKRAVKALLGLLDDDDRVTLLAFDDRPETLLDGVSPVGAVGASMRLDALTTRGATQLAPALDIAVNALQRDITSGRLAALLLITDGRTYGDDEQCLLLAERARLLGVPILCFGLGLEWNRELLDSMAATSGGSCAFVEDPARLTALLEHTVSHLRSTLASNVRLSFAPASGVSVLRASTVAPELADVYGGQHAPGEPVEVKFGALASDRDAESEIALWELLLDPHALTSDAATRTIILGAVSADWSHGREHALVTGRLEEPTLVPLRPEPGLGPTEPEVRLALELLMAYRLHARADQLASAGSPKEAAAALTTSALRLRAAGDPQRAEDAQQAASSLLAALGDGPTAALRAKYAVRNANQFHHLRRKLRAPYENSATP
ncbi:MAG: DnaJ domain-containing protein [Chloroflexota bacterium]|nr:DnaJ domain-containing protein [Chloroflexota bacterium]